MMNNFSPNMLKTFDECEYKFFLKYVKKLSVPQRSALFEKGKKIHALASYYLRGENIEKMENALSAEEKKVWMELKGNKYLNLKPVQTEYNLSCKIGKYWIGGRLDALVANVMPPTRSLPHEGGGHNAIDKSYFILDYKTGNIPQDAERDFQTVTYLLCADKLLKKKGGYELLKFVYIGLKQAEEKVIEFDSELKKNYEERIVSICDKIIFAVNSNVFAKNTNRCRHCEFKNICKEA